VGYSPLEWIAKQWGRRKKKKKSFSKEIELKKTSEEEKKGEIVEIRFRRGELPQCRGKDRRYTGERKRKAY